MQVKLFEVRDEATCISAIGIRLAAYELSGRERWLLRRTGYGEPLILFGRTEGGPFANDLYNHSGSRTMRWAHKIVEENWDILESGAMIDVRAAMGGEPMESDYHQPGEMR